jgi:N-acyl-D-amino-acid deacylase
MRLGRTHRKLQSQGEVTYYDPRVSVSVFEKDLGKPVPAAYGAWHFEAMDSHGAWIASASDLARFAMAFDDSEHCPILSAKSMRQMHVRPSGAAGYGKDGQPKEVYYTFGWSNRLLPSGKINHRHTGSLPGTATIIIRRHDGKNFVALFNGRMSPHVSHLGRAIDPVLHRAANAVTTWPEPSPR